MKFKLIFTLAAAALFAAAPAWAGSILFDFGACGSITSSVSGCPGDLGASSATFTDTTSTYSVIATGYASATAPNNLFVKDDSASEHGIGLTGTTDTDNEINFGQYIYLDMTNLLSHGIPTATIGFGSLQNGEYGQVCETTAVGTPGSLNCKTVGEFDSTAIGNANVSFSTADPVLDYTVPARGDGNFLILGSVSTPTTITPEPASVVLFGTMLFAFGLVWKQRRDESA
ncbi:MAG: hypothetical protein KGM47_02425 [Acidobacteriota bacterium]|nr:hypothetical protein [Acidobacteriota bacterium]